VAGRRPKLVAAFGVLALSIAVASCGGVSPSAKSRPSSATLPSVSQLCPPVSEIDFYVAVPTGVATSERSYEAATSPTVTCGYGHLDRAPRRSVVVSFVLFPSKSIQPAGVKVHHLHDVGNWAISYRRGHVTHVVVDQGYVAVSVSSNAGSGDLLGLAEEELARVPIADRS
jgi:hypothetical protein